MMRRDKNRIKPFLKEFEKLWNKYPDLRFNQLITILNSKNSTDSFYIEDDKFLEIIERGL